MKGIEPGANRTNHHNHVSRTSELIIYSGADYVSPLFATRLRTLCCVVRKLPGLPKSPSLHEYLFCSVLNSSVVR